MNFFEHQAHARKQSRWIIIAFVFVTVLIVLAVDFIVLALFSLQAPLSAGVGHIAQPATAALLNPQIWIANSNILLGSSVATVAVIGLASMGKIVSLRSGGGKVARDMGAAIVTPDATDPLRRRLYNVVEEIALASGTPVPEVYIMENEPGINAFAAGYSPADAAIAVTQGTLEKLSRAELQGVIAHEFSHIFNGDMRINIRLMGVIFGITVLAIFGRKLLTSSRHRISSSRSQNAGAAVAIGFGLMLVGYLGLFFARWMKSALSRQREYLADASAVQFTRDPSGIAGALKKIAAYSHSSYLNHDAEEVSHMLFGAGYRSFLFATHPPLPKRIERIERHFDAKEITSLAKKLKAQEHREHIQAEQAEREQSQVKSSQRQGGVFSVDALIENIGNPEIERILAAAVLAEEIPSALSSAARSLEWAPEVLFYCLLDEDSGIREQQMLAVLRYMGDISEKKLSHLVNANAPLIADQRLPLLEICFPALKRRPITEIEKILVMINHLVSFDHKVDSFEYLLSRLVKQFLSEAKNPSRSRLYGRRKLAAHPHELSTVISIVASHGQQMDGGAGLQMAQRAFKAGMSSVGINYTNLNFKDDWQQSLDKALTTLDQLRPMDKNQVVRALATTVADDQKIVTAEHEMLRVICSLIHVPLPILQQAERRA